MIRILNIGIIVFLLVIVAYQVLANWEDLDSVSWQFDYLLLAVSLCLITGYYFFMADLLRRVLKLVGTSVPYRSAVRIYFLNNVLSLIPGKVATVLGVSSYGTLLNIPRSHSLLAIILIQAYALASGGGLAILYVLGFLLESVSWQSYLSPLIFLVLASLLGSHPQLIIKFIKYLGRLAGREISIDTDFSYARTLLFIGVYLGSWTWLGVAFWSFTRAVCQCVEVSQAPLMTLIFTTSYIAGFLSFFAPAGLGVREGVLTLLLVQHGIELPQAGVIALAARMWVTLPVLGWFLFSRGIRVGAGGEAHRSIPSPLPETETSVDSERVG